LWTDGSAFWTADDPDIHQNPKQQNETFKSLMENSVVLR